MISVADIIAGLTTGAGSTGDYTLIENKINQAIAYVTAGTAISASASGDMLSEQPWTYNGEFWISARTNDYQIVNVYGYDIEGTETTLTANDYFKAGERLYKLNSNGYIRVKVEYTSNYASRMINEIIKDITMYEFLREPRKTGALNKQGEGAGQVTISYTQPGEFYQEIDRRIDRLILRY